jgi:hypothetical protein
MDSNQHAAQNAMSLAVVSDEGSGSLPKASKRVQGLEVVWFGETKTNHITPKSNTQGNDFISASGYINADQRLKPGEAWSAAPAGTTVLGSGPTWGVYETASGEQTWEGVSAVPTDVSTGSVIDAGECMVGGYAGKHCKSRKCHKRSRMLRDQSHV